MCVTPSVGRTRRAPLTCQCSNDNPCQSCLQSALKGAERKVLSFCYCVRTRFSDVNIFASAQAASTTNMQIETLMARMSVLLNRIAAPANFSLASDPAKFNDTLTSWLSDPTLSFPNGSVVGLCCSSLLSLQFRDESLEDDGLATEFRRFLLATSLARSNWQGGRGQLKQGEICVAGQVSGYRLIKRLDRTLTPQFLAKCDRETCQILFLLVLGAVLGMGYASSLPESPQYPEVLSPELRQSPSLWIAMKEHLCQMLAHHLIFLGSMLGIKLDTQLEQRIIDTASNRWDKMESYIWADSNSFAYGRPPYGLQGYPVPSSPGYFWPSPARSRPYWEEPPPPPLPSIDCLVPIPCPEFSQFQPSAFDDWSQNPPSYLDMADEPVHEFLAQKPPPPEDPVPRDDIYSATPRPGPQRAPPPRSNTEPSKTSDSMSEETPETRRRSVWLVRPYDAGPEHGQVNVYARLRGDQRAGDFRFFV